MINYERGATLDVNDEGQSNHVVIQTEQRDRTHNDTAEQHPNLDFTAYLGAKCDLSCPGPT